jgi:outer membrane protein assembly factor BamA
VSWAQPQQPQQMIMPDTGISNMTVVVKDIIVEGNKKTKEYIVEREFAVLKGETLTRRELAERVELTRRQLVNTSLFLTVNVVAKEEMPGEMTVYISLRERWYIFPIPYFRLVDRNFNQWWVEQNHDLNRVNYGIKFTYNNITGRNDKLRLWLFNGYMRQIQLNYTQPYLDKKLQQGVSVNLVYAKVREVHYVTRNNKQVFYPDTAERRLGDLAFVRELFRVDASYIYRPGLKTRHFFRLGYVNDSVSDSIAVKNPDYFGNGRSKVSFPEFAYSYQHNNSDYIFYPLKGFSADASFIVRDPFGPMRLYQLESNAKYSFRVFKNAYINQGASMVLKLPFDQPFYNRRLMGFGNNYMRGLEYFVVDGVFSAMSRTTFKLQLLDFKLNTPFKKSKYHAVFPFKIFIKTYGDLGYAYSKPAMANMLNNRLLYSGGLGLDVLTFYDTVIKFEFSFNQLKQSGLFLHYRLE